VNVYESIVTQVMVARMSRSMVRTGQPRVITVEEDMIVAAIIGLQAELTIAGTDIQSR
jgi:hypothetical protein